ncbi:MAG: PIN domain-containing protein [Alphaproteobacteria bacterium]|nr:PIN domain-containing protein [Alphaproteobacteria bacterium]
MTGYLLDSHIFVWLKRQSWRIKPAVLKTIAEGSSLHLSVASIWELYIKLRTGKDPGFGDVLLEGPSAILSRMADSGVTLLPITVEHVAHTARLPLHHRDPFDRMLIAQAQIERLTLVTHDDTFDRYARLTVLRV